MEVGKRVNEKTETKNHKRKWRYISKIKGLQRFARFCRRLTRKMRFIFISTWRGKSTLTVFSWHEKYGYTSWAPWSLVGFSSLKQFFFITTGDYDITTWLRSSRKSALLIFFLLLLSLLLINSLTCKQAHFLIHTSKKTVGDKQPNLKTSPFPNSHLKENSW